MNLVVIPAKKSSSRVPQKNFRPFYKSLSLVDITMALASNVIRSSFKTILSTDYIDFKFENEYIQLIPREPNLSSVETPILSVLQSLCSQYSLDHFSRIILLQPTSPFRTVSNFVNFLETLQGYSDYMSHSLVSVYPVVDAHPARMYIPSSDSYTLALPSYTQTNSQNLPPCFHRNGCFYSFSVYDILRGNLYSENLSLFHMNYISSFNIDTIPDFHIARMAYPLFVSGSLSSLEQVEF